MHGSHVRSNTQVIAITLHWSAAVRTRPTTMQQLPLIPYTLGEMGGSREQQVGGRCLVRRGGMGALRPMAARR